MSSSPRHFEDGRLREPVPTSLPSMLFDLDAETRRLESEQPWQAGHTANTIVKYPDLRIILVAVRAGSQLVHHSTIGRISIQCLSGRLRVHLPNEVVDVTSGNLLTLDQEVPHDVFAIADSTFLLTIAWPKQETPVSLSASHERVLSESAGVSDSGYIAPPSAENVIHIDTPRTLREVGLDKTLSDTFPCSDALSSIPDPVLKA